MLFSSSINLKFLYLVFHPVALLLRTEHIRLLHLLSHKSPVGACSYVSLKNRLQSDMFLKMKQESHLVFLGW